MQGKNRKMEYDIYLYVRKFAIAAFSTGEFKNVQDTQNVDLYDQDCEPFRKSDGSQYSVKDTFTTEPLGYNYDNSWMHHLNN